MEALRAKKIAGAGLDVFEKDPLPLKSIDECTYICVDSVEMFAKGKFEMSLNLLY
jgi:D-3-phosphoglycerate dehydrogenase